MTYNLMLTRLDIMKTHLKNDKEFINELFSLVESSNFTEEQLKRIIDDVDKIFNQITDIKELLS